jgi:hypothetical protein
MEGKFEVLEEVSRQYERFRAQGTLVRFLPPPEVIPDSEVIPDNDIDVIPDDDSEVIPDADSEVIPDADSEVIPGHDGEVIPDNDKEVSPDPITHFETCVNALFEYALKDIKDSDMVGVVIQNQNNDKPIGFSFRRKDQLSVEVIWKLFEKVAQSNAKFNALDPLIVTVHSVKVPVGFGGGVKTKVRQLDTLAHLKKSIVRVNAAENCLAHALVIAIAKVENDPNYKAYRQGRKIRPEVQRLLEMTGIDLSSSGGIPELERFQEHFRDQYKIVVYGGLNCDSIYFEGRVDAPKRLNLLLDDANRHYHVIHSLTGAMAKEYICHACGNGCKRDVTHVCDQICSDCKGSFP